MIGAADHELSKHHNVTRVYCPISDPVFLCEWMRSVHYKLICGGRGELGNVELSGGVRGWSENGVIWTVEMKCGVWSGEEIERWSKKKIKEKKGKTKKT